MASIETSLTRSLAHTQAHQTHTYNTMRLIGLTGSIACGKSTLLQRFREHGIVTINADEVSHQLMQPGQSVYRAVVKHFGTEILDAQTRGIDRDKLGAIVFHDKNKLRELERLTHRPIMLEMARQVLVCSLRRTRLVVLELPLLFKIGAQAVMPALVVYVSADEQLKRLMARNSLTRDEAERRIALQLPIEQQLRLADFTFDNSAALDEAAVRRCIEQLSTTRLPRAFLFDAIVWSTILGVMIAAFFAARAVWHLVA